MARPPNYNHERKERERLKAAKKAEKLAARAAKNQSDVSEDAPAESQTEDDAGKPGS